MNNHNQLELEEYFKQLFIASKGLLTEDQIKEVQRFVEHKEYGLAFETYCDICTEERINLIKECIDLLRQLARSMQIDERRVENLNVGNQSSR
jgi:hypothetical protein